jgi:cytochrome oxidase Cu insertion factor (SCO1/SenC/PrrC family)
MKSKLMAALAAGVVLLLVSGSLWAHHGGVQYDTKHAVTVTGTVTEFLFTNPHVQIHFEVKDESGNAEKWVAETASPQRLYSFGWNAKTQLKDGQKIVSVIKLVGGNAPVLTQGAAE